MPGNGTPNSSMAVTGNLTFQSGAQYGVRVNPTTASSAKVTGTANLNGGTVRVLADTGTYAPATTYTILTATGGRSGTFDGVTSNLAFLDPTLSYDASDALLTLTRNDNTVSDFGSTPNQRAVAGAIDRLGAGNAVYDSLIGLGTDQVSGALQQVSGESYATGMQMIGDTSALFSQSLMGRMGLAGGGGMTAGGGASNSMSGYFEVPVLTAASAAISGVVTPTQPNTGRRIAWFAPVGPVAAPTTTAMRWPATERPAASPAAMSLKIQWPAASF